ncbi:type IV pilus modification protein PilV [Thiorhodovibrio winogradskyi]|uniref:Type IV pilus modification protein PilV n=1 Tax=Thiorhodovibrio winogradskyi TaxID=77007 RepID=A0ABZ0SF35_9GAMM|nr:type IV pilus modification protein PilV [Thiorhodovibrio winogradskyi]
MVIYNHSIRVRTAESGFTLIEALVAAIVLSVGLLGLAGLQATSQKLAYSANIHSQAVNLGFEIGDAIRANAANASSYNETLSATCAQIYPRPDTGDAAADDLDELANRIACLLPGNSGGDLPRAEITINSDNTADISIFWDESRARLVDDDGQIIADAAEDQRQVYTTQITY